MEITPDNIIFWQWGFVKLNATIVFTWLVMAVIILFAWFATRNITSGTDMSRMQNILESLVTIFRNQIEDIIHQRTIMYLSFIGTLFLFISISNLLSFIPVYHPPTGSLMTTFALAICTFFAVPVFGIREKGVLGYLKHYVEPNFAMLPIHIISEISRTVALAVRLFGNVMSGSLMAAMLLSVAPLFAPVLMEVLELLIGQVQAYIFSVLATVYIGSAARTRKKREQEQEKPNHQEEG